MKKILGKVKIKPQWDEKISWYKDAPVIPSTLELSAFRKIRHFLLRNESGSLIVSGVRGAGKTTTIINAVRSCEKEGTVFPVYLNVVHLEAYGNGNLETDFRMLKILQLLIKSLAKEVKRTQKLPQDLVWLLEDCEATKLSIAKTSSSKAKMSARTKAKSGFNFLLKPLEWIGIHFNHEVGIDTEATFSEGNDVTWEKTGLTIEDVVDRFSMVIKKLEKSGIFTSEITKSHTLSIKLWGRKIKINWFLPKRIQQKKLVFVLDELDVYDGDGGSKITPGEVLNVVKKFKNLFTLSTAHFIFIVGKNTYLAARNDPYRTLFSERIFLSNPDGKMLSKYLDEIVDGNVRREYSAGWEEWKWYVVSRSKHNLYDLVTTINADTEYDEEQKELYVTLTEKTPAERALLSFHYLLNDIFVYHRQSPLFEHHNNDLFEELYDTELVFKKYVIDGISEGISLGTRDTGNMEVNRAIKDAKIALIQTLYSFTNKKAPDYDPTVPVAILPWDEFRQVLTFEKVRKGIFGDVTTLESGFIADLDGFIANVNYRFQQYVGFEMRKDNIKEFIGKLPNLLWVEFNVTDVETLKSTVDQITTVPVHERNWDLTSQAMQSLSAISSILSRFVLMGKNLVAKSEWGEINYDKLNVRLGSDGSHGNKLMSRTTIFLPEIQENDSIELRAKVKITSGGLVNFLFYKEYNTTEVEGEFYMARLDTRERNADGILHKPKGAYWGMVPGSDLAPSVSDAEKEIDVKIELVNGFLTLRKKKGHRFILIAKSKFEERCVLVGIANEISPVEVSIQHLKIDDIYYK
jgi:hypothetical protein